MCPFLYFAASTSLCPEHGPDHGCGEDPSNVPRMVEERAWPWWVAWSSPRCWPLTLLLPETDKLLCTYSLQRQVSYHFQTKAFQTKAMCCVLSCSVRSDSLRPHGL